jgi:hypothetical protein
LPRTVIPGRRTYGRRACGCVLWLWLWLWLLLCWLARTHARARIPLLFLSLLASSLRQRGSARARAHIALGTDQTMAQFLACLLMLLSPASAFVLEGYPSNVARWASPNGRLRPQSTHTNLLPEMSSVTPSAWTGNQLARMHTISPMRSIHVDQTQLPQQALAGAFRMQ